MAIKQLHIENFRSFKELDLELDDFNVVIGANASGKSNFIEIFRFLRDIARDGLENAISLQGGTAYIKNLNHPDKNIIISYTMDTINEIPKLVIDEDSASVYNLQNTFVLSVEDGVIFIDGDFIKLGVELSNTLDKKSKENIDIEIRKTDTGEFYRNISPDYPIRIYDNIIDFLTRLYTRSPDKRELLNTLILETSPYNKDTKLTTISFFDLHPGITKRDAPKLGKIELNDDAGNLSITLDKILENKNEKRRFLNYVNYLLPFVKDVKVDRDFDGAYITKVKETYFEDKYLPSYMLSDGTINVLSLVVALFFEKKPFIIIEEPERHIHPSLISGLMDLIKEASEDKQVIITTHNPEFVKHTPDRNLLLATRNEEGFTDIVRPVEKENIRACLDNDLGIDELYIQSLLEI